MSLTRSRMAFKSHKATVAQVVAEIDRGEERAVRRSALMTSLVKLLDGREASTSANRPAFKAIRVVPKSPRASNQAVLDMARDKPCLLLSPICRPDPQTTVACHGAGVANGKGMGYKTGDHLSCWGCAQCNHFTDAYGRATADQKTAVFDAGMVRQIAAWSAIAADPKAKPIHKRAAQWALDQHALSSERKEAKNV